MNDSVKTRQGGPPLAVLALISLGSLLAGLGLGVALGGIPPSPFAAGTSVQNFFVGHPLAIQVAAVGVFGSSVPLAIYAATASARLRQLDVTAPAVMIALAGGILAAAALCLGSLALWILSRPEVTADEPLVRSLYFLVFLTGGPAHVVCLGLLVAGIAVSSLILGLVPRSVAWTGLVIAVLAEVTTLVLVWPRLDVLLPIARFTGLVWLVVAGAMLPPQRQRKADHTFKPDR
jgi:hypothetical protein